MTINRSDAELNQFIAEKLEPLALLGEAAEYLKVWGSAKGTKCWRTEWTVEDGQKEFIEWQPRDFVNDPSASDLLFDAMANPDWYIEEGWDPFKKEWTTSFMKRSYAVAHRASGPNRRRNRAEAFALAHGLEQQ